MPSYVSTSENPRKESPRLDRPRFNLNRLLKSPPMAGFCNSVGGLETPNFRTCRPKMPKVSGHSLNNSRFLKISAGDRFELRWAPGLTVQLAKILRLCRREIGNSEPALCADHSTLPRSVLRPPDHTELGICRLDCRAIGGGEPPDARCIRSANQVMARLHVAWRF